LKFRLYNVKQEDREETWEAGGSEDMLKRPAQWVRLKLMIRRRMSREGEGRSGGEEGGES
jgi:hypothetical protein